MPKKNIEGKIILTGGHAATTALATFKELSRRGYSQIYWVGPKYAFEGKGELTLAAKIFPKQGFIFRSIISGRIQKKFTRWTIPSLVKIPIGFTHALIILLQIKPAAIVSFGGFASFPVVFSAWLLRVPVLLHEQTSVAGQANIHATRFARKIAISFRSSNKYFPGNKTVFTGCPVLPGITKLPPPTTLPPTPTVLVIGGSSGALRINKVIQDSLHRLLSSYKLIHLTGDSDYPTFQKLKESLPSSLSANYTTHPSVHPNEMPDLFQKSQIIISRGGANTIFEIAHTHRPAIVIPIPWSYKNEQHKNAKWLAKSGLAFVLEEKDLTPNSLIQMIDKIKANWSKMKSSDISIPKDSASSLADLVQEVLK